ncbi:hypothetical protein [uncultured Maricaulis sp.]|uniref:hypothetical protein n=1 Tax=uncultured Maricaulis sp. TaxID=174710 RepID=UPI0025D0A757|nr:hypothetical protein [uncultured Maricaulis sp.]
MLNKILTTSAIVAALATGSSFAQQGGSNQLSYDLSAQVSSVCGVFNAGGTEIDVDFGDLANTETTGTVEQAAGSGSYACNSPNGFTRTIASTNGGYLVRSGTGGGAQNQIAYEMRHTGSNGLTMNWTQLTSAATADLNGPSFLTGQTGNVDFRVYGVRSTNAGADGAAYTTVFAGDYSDIVTVTVTAK